MLNWKRSIRGRILWSTLISFFLAVFMASIWNNFFVLIGTFLLFFFLFMDNIVRYIRSLADGLMRIAQGNLDYRLPPSRYDELGSVANNINYMAEQLHDRIDRERRIEKSKMELITNVSHDLRTPLTSIIGYLNLLKHDDYGDLDEHKRYIQNTYNKTQQLKKLIDDLFEYTRLTSGEARLSFRPVDLAGLMEQVLTEFEPLAHEQSLTVRKLCERERVLGLVDAEKFVRAVDNLLMNALKFSVKPGAITVRLFERGSRIRLEVENRGTPISKEQELLLFDRFYKAEPSRNDHSMLPGAGLGLSIARSIAELHGGHIGLEHRNGLFTFYIELPRKEQTPPYPERG
ncbi:sensor histidine kinase [Paenibacillus mesophilus]|uniref:sensor histidine kinase n=1 Tax=Paenibacillus mesophilus TaxID=2582849 RepID=UPI001EE47B73|nr:HAMP domain-containing sensor histidine kinase [Paenibacillus mesophilus]